MTTRYELIAVEQPGTNVKALHQAYQAFVDKLNDLYDRQVKNGESDWWSGFNDPQVHFIDNRIVVFSIMTNVPDDKDVVPEPLPFDEPPLPVEDAATTSQPLSTWSEWVDVPPEETAPEVKPPKRKPGRPRKSE